MQVLKNHKQSYPMNPNLLLLVPYLKQDQKIQHQNLLNLGLQDYHLPYLLLKKLRKLYCYHFLLQMYQINKSLFLYPSYLLLVFLLYKLLLMQQNPQHHQQLPHHVTLTKLLHCYNTLYRQRLYFLREGLDKQLRKPFLFLNWYPLCIFYQFFI